MDVPTLNTFLSAMFAVTTVWSTEETGDINCPFGNGKVEKRKSQIPLRGKLLN